MHWRGQDSKRAKSTLADFHEEMGLEHQRRAFALANSKEPRALGVFMKPAVQQWLLRLKELDT